MATAFLITEIRSGRRGTCCLAGPFGACLAGSPGPAAEHAKVAFLRPLPVRALYGVGTVTEQVLVNAGLKTVGDIQDYRGDLRALVGSFARRLRQFAVGQDDRPLELGDEIKSTSNEETFLKDTDDRKILRACLQEQAADIEARLKHRRLGACCLMDPQRSVRPKATPGQGHRGPDPVCP